MIQVADWELATDDEKATLYNEIAQWVRSRPPKIQELLRKFPPGCTVMAAEGHVLRCPAPGTYGGVVAYNENGCVTVWSGTAKAHCEPEWLVVVEYNDTPGWSVDPEFIASILDGGDA